LLKFYTDILIIFYESYDHEFFSWVFFFFFIILKILISIYFLLKHLIYKYHILKIFNNT